MRGSQATDTHPEVPGGSVARPLVETQDLSRRFEGPPVVDALCGLNLVIEAGSHVSIVGSSGSGKSTLLHLIGLLDSPTSGSYWLGGTDTSELDDRARTSLRAEFIGFVFQAFHLMSGRSCLENVELGLAYNLTVPRHEHRDRAMEALKKVGLAHRYKADARLLSGGEQQRTAIARAIAAEPLVLLADEPTGNLDSRNSGIVMDILASLNASGTTLAVITHDLEVAATAPRRIQLSDGRVVE